MSVLFWYIVKFDNSVRYVQQRTLDIRQDFFYKVAKKTRPFISGHPVYILKYL